MFPSSFLLFYISSSSMDAAMEELWKTFHLSKEEKGVLEVSYQEVAISKQHAKFSILFKLQSNKDFNKEAYKLTIQKLWRGSHGIIIKEVGNNLFLAIFVSEEDMVEVLNRSLWFFHRRLILLKRINGDLSPGNVSVQYSPFWIWVFNIPIKSMNKSVSTRIANENGVPLLVDAPKNGLAWGPFFRFR